MELTQCLKTLGFKHLMWYCEYENKIIWYSWQSIVGVITHFKLKDHCVIWISFIYVCPVSTDYLSTIKCCLISWRLLSTVLYFKRLVVKLYCFEVVLLYINAKERFHSMDSANKKYDLLWFNCIFLGVLKIAVQKALN